MNAEKERQFWREIHKALEIITKAVVKHKLSTRQSDEQSKKEAA